MCVWPCSESIYVSGTIKTTAIFVGYLSAICLVVGCVGLVFAARAWLLLKLHNNVFDVQPN